MWVYILKRQKKKKFFKMLDAQFWITISSNKELLLFKVDFEKSYDSVDWNYLDAVTSRMTFPTL